MARHLGMLHTSLEMLGYGSMGVNLSNAVRRAGVQVHSGDVHPSTEAVVWCATPGFARGWWAGQWLGMFTMWEGTRLPEAYQERLHNFDAAIVPCSFNVELFSRFHPNVVRVPLGVDPHRWQFRERVPGPEFRFLVAGSGPRKGADAAIAAFEKAFRGVNLSPKPVLIHKSPKGKQFPGATRVVDGHLSAAEEVELYASAHCYLGPSRGEGFGLQPLQAIAQGCPTILTDAHGHADFAHLGFGVPARLGKAAPFAFGNAGDWWNPDVDVLAERMRWVYDNYLEACRFAREASKVARAEWTWDRSAAALLDVVGDRLGLMEPSRWEAATLLEYRVRVTRRVRCQIGPDNLSLQPGVDYWLSADAKRVLDDAGYLDDSCRDEDGRLPCSA